MISLSSFLSSPVLPMLIPGTCKSFKYFLVCKSLALTCETYPRICADELSGYILATETTGFTPSNSCKNKFNLENSDQVILSETMMGSQGFCLTIVFFKKNIFLSEIFNIVFNLTNNLSISFEFSGIR